MKLSAVITLVALLALPVTPVMAETLKDKVARGAAKTADVAKNAARQLDQTVSSTVDLAKGEATPDLTRAKLDAMAAAGQRGRVVAQFAHQHGIASQNLRRRDRARHHFTRLIATNEQNGFCVDNCTDRAHPNLLHRHHFRKLHQGLANLVRDAGRSGSAKCA